MRRGAPSTLSKSQSVFEEDEAEKAAEKKIKNLKIKKKIKINNNKFGQKNVFLIFRNCHLKGSQGDAVYILSPLKVFLKRIEQKRLLKVHPPNVGWGKQNPFYSNATGRLSFLNTGMKRQH